jgi:hypothetical protein
MGILLGIKNVGTQNSKNVVVFRALKNSRQSIEEQNFITNDRKITLEKNFRFDFSFFFR